jgi:alpha/beta superfamily hydrolase
MNKRIAVLIVFAIWFVVPAKSAHAEEVTLPYKGVTLNANLELAEGKQLADGGVLITHGTLAHSGMEVIATLQELFKQHGRSTLAVTLGLGVDNRHGMYDCKTPHTHRHTDAVNELAAWLDWLKGRGAQQVVLMGHSRFLYCEDTSVTAASFVSYYALEPKRDTVNLLPEIGKPTLVIAGTEDTVVGGLEEKVAPLADGKRLQLRAIEGADHFFRDLYAEEVVEAVDEFLASLPSS